MLSFQYEGTRGPWIVMLHWLGGGAQTWQEVSRILVSRGVRCLALDLPGFGDSAHTSGFSVEAMTDAVASTLRTLRPQLGLPAGLPWVVAGHSMGGTVAALLARRAVEGEAGLEGLCGLVLVSPSPPGPEPMKRSKRRSLLLSLGQRSGDAAQDREAAEAFVDNNTGILPLPPSVRARAVDGVLGMNRTAFRMWLESGSKEDWRERIGTLPLPAVVLAGTEDAALGPKAQRAATLPALPRGELAVLQGAGHLAPLERPGEVAEIVTAFLTKLKLPLSTRETVPGPRTARLLQSERTSPKTAEVICERLAQRLRWNYEPAVFAADEFRTLRRLAEAVVPDAGFDLAAALDAQLAAKTSDGWRFAVLPPDRNAWKRGLLSLDLAAQRQHGVRFAALHGEQQTALLRQAAAGELSRGLLRSLRLGNRAQGFDTEAMQRWMEDVRGEFVRLYVSDPRTIDRMGYTGFADDFGFTQIELGQHEEFDR